MSAPSESPAAASPPRASDDVAEVLVVDDNPLDLLRAGRLVDQDRRCRATFAADGGEAMERLADHSVAVVLTDLQMEGMSGLELVRAVRKHHPQVPVILMTGHGSEDVAMEALRVGATDYVPKQRLAQELRPTLARALRTASTGDRRKRCLESLIHRESRFELRNDPDLIPPLLELLQEEMTQLDCWDSAEKMRTAIALDEALRNALYHGNLEISSELRQENDRRLGELTRERSSQPRYRDRRIHLLIAHGQEESRYVIRDEGPGFDTSRVDRPVVPEDLLRSGGRGLLLMRSFMDSVSFNAAGNEVTLIKRREPESIPALAACSSGSHEGNGKNGIARRSSTALSVLESLTAEKAREPSNGNGQSRAQLPAVLDGRSQLPMDFYKQLLDQLHDAVYFVDTQRRILYWNQAAERLTGFTSDEVLGRSCYDGLLDHHDLSGCQLCHTECPLVLSMRHDRPAHERLVFRHKDGRRISVDVKVVPVRNEAGVVIGGAEIFSDATSSVVVENALRQVREAADHDALTGLANRRCLDRVLSHYLDEMRRSGSFFSVILADLDHFKQINDTWGHLVGDQVLTRFAAMIQGQSRTADLVARFGGEEFIMLLPGQRQATAAHVAERLRGSAVTATPEELGDRRLTASFGVAEARVGETAAQLLNRADEALYRAKSLGRNRVEVAAAELTASEAEGDRGCSDAEGITPSPRSGIKD